MLMPKKTKYRKTQRGRLRGMSTSNNTIVFGDYALQSLSLEYITDRQIESARRAITRHLRRTGRLWIRIFPDVPVSKKPAEVRMGKGKGTPEFWVCRVKPGKIMFELDGVTEVSAKEAFSLAAAKLPLNTKFVKKIN